MQVVRASAEHGEAIALLFERTDCPCYCRYWDFPGDGRAWQDRCANDRNRSRAELLAALESEGELFGVVALDEGKVVGWLRLASPETMRKQYEGRLYRNLPCFGGDRSNVLAVACFLVDEERRRSGVARALLREGIQLARARGAKQLEAFPRGADDVSDAEHWLGPQRIYQDEGFEIVNDFRPYPVMRLAL
jgi:GNAT superfamily N-acetyltransferase